MFENRTIWALTTVTAIAALLAVGVWLNGYRTTPKPNAPVNPIAPSNRPDADPLEPRLFGQSTPVRVHVAGAVKTPGVYTLPGWSRVIDAVKKAGGAASNADLDGINLADPIRDGEQIRIPVKGQPETLPSHQPTPAPAPVPPTVGGEGMGRYPISTGGSTSERARKATPAAPVNINTAGIEQLQTLPGVGAATAERIVQFRQEHGPFLKPEDLMNVKGIGEKKFARLQPLIAAP